MWLRIQLVSAVQLSDLGVCLPEGASKEKNLSEMDVISHCMKIKALSS